MVSRTKYEIDNAGLEALLRNAGISGVSQLAPLGAGEYNAVFSAKASGKDYVIKIAPTPDVPVLTYEKNIMASEVFWYDKMREQGAIRVPEVYFSDFSRKKIPADYFIMEKIAGEQLDKIQLSKAEKEQSQTQTARMAAQIHSIRGERFGYIQNELYDDWYQAIRAMTRALTEDCAAVGKACKHGERLLAYIEQYRAVLQRAECCMVNFDIWPPNILCTRENGAVHYTWIDPERSFWGDRIADFVCLEMTSPFAKKEKSLAAYNTAAEKPVAVTREHEIRYAVAQAYLGLLMETEKYYRYSLGHFGWWRNVFACAWLFKSAFSVLKHG